MAEPTRFGALLRTYRERARLTQPELARRAGTADSSISQWENGHRGRRLQRDTIIRLAEAIGLDGEDRTALLEAAGRDIPEDHKPQREQVSVIRAIRLDPWLTSKEKDELCRLYELLVERRKR